MVLRDWVTSSLSAIIQPISLLVYLNQYFGDASSTPNAPNIEPIGAAVNALFRKFISWIVYKEAATCVGALEPVYREQRS